MRRYQFRLGALLRVRRVEASLARERVAAASRRLNSASQVLQVAERRYVALPELLTPSDQLSFSDWRARGERAALALYEAKRRASEAAALREQERVRAARADQRVRALERLEARRLGEWKLAAARADSAALDDFATVRFVTEARRRRAAGGRDAH